MEPTKAAKKLTYEIIDYYRLPEQVCFDFIFQRMQWAVAIGYELRQSTMNKGKMVVQMTMTGKTLRVFATGMNASRALNISVGSISDACHGKQKSVKGYKFRFLDPNDYYTYIKKK